VVYYRGLVRSVQVETREYINKFRRNSFVFGMNCHIKRHAELLRVLYKSVFI
jgi:hypothetical protein